MPVLEIESHMLSTCVERFGDDQVVATRLLDLAGPVLDGDTQHRALVTFSDRATSADPATVGYLSDSGPLGLTIIGWLPTADLDAVVALLDGRPIVLRYRLAYGSVSVGDLDRLRLEAAPAEERRDGSWRRPRWSRSFGRPALSDPTCRRLPLGFC